MPTLHALVRRALPHLEKHSAFISVVGQTLCLVGALLIAYVATFIDSLRQRDYFLDLAPAAWYLPLKIFLLWRFEQFRVFLPYFRTPDLIRILAAVIVSLLAALIVFEIGQLDLSFPRRLILTEAAYSLLALVGFRLGLRSLWEQYGKRGRQRGAMTHRIALIGAGELGERLLSESLSTGSHGLEVVALFDDDGAKQGRQLHGLRIRPVPEDFHRWATEKGLNEIVVAIARPPRSRMQDWAVAARHAGIALRIVPEVSAFSGANNKLSRLREVQIEDLLGRDPVKLEDENIRQLIRHRRIMVTGGGGSIGKELCRQIVRLAPSSLVIVDQSEFNLYEVEMELTENGFGKLIQPFVADVTNQERMHSVLATTRPEVLFHAAAYKHVPIMEREPFEALHNNALATFRLGKLAVQYALERFILISTDKAIRSANIMGASKRLAEIGLQHLHNQHGQTTKFSAVRFGNVLGSSGSVLPLFRRQIAEGGPVTVTHPEMKRYFMTIPEAVGLVLQATVLGEGGDIMVLDMGDPVPIEEVARRMILLSGLEPDHDIAIEYTGLRPGEKLSEEIIRDGEPLLSTRHPRILRYAFSPADLPDPELWSELASFNPANSKHEIQAWLQRRVADYQPVT